MCEWWGGKEGVGKCPERGESSKKPGGGSQHGVKDHHRGQKERTGGETAAETTGLAIWKSQNGESAPVWGERTRKFNTRDNKKGPLPKREKEKDAI